jgi:RHS repeat-associated protein
MLRVIVVSVANDIRFRTISSRLPKANQDRSVSRVAGRCPWATIAATTAFPARARATASSAGRLTDAQETPTGGTCTTRAYTFDADPNRRTKTTRSSTRPDASASANSPAGFAGIEVFHYDGSGDSPSWTSLGATWNRDIPGIHGELAAVQESGGTTTFRLTDLHGDVVASASSNPAETKLLATARFTEFGEPASGNTSRFGWLGSESRRTELSSGVIQMGARSYIPQLRRFLTPDPIRGGSANAYDYVDQDPINSIDPAGTKKKKKYHSGGRGGCPHCEGGGGSKVRHPGNNGSQQPKLKLLRTHSVEVSGVGTTSKGGKIGATYSYLARESVSVTAYALFRGVTSDIAEAEGPDGTLDIPTIDYSGPVSSGEVLTVCVVGAGSGQSERNCYNHEITIENWPRL